MRVLAIGDVVGDYGCAFLRKILPVIKRNKNIDVCIVNGENSAQGNGLLPFSAEGILASGADVITTGNHVYNRREIYDYLDATPFVIRPANYGNEAPGYGYYIIDKGSFRLAVVNLMGTVFMDNLENPFKCIDGILNELKEYKNIIVDFHAEATSEKRAMGFYLDGRVSAVFGTHTHVQTADEQILPKGTGYITDLGMTGSVQSVLGITPEIVITKLKTNLPVKFDNPQGECKADGCIFEIDERTGRTVSVERISVK